MGCTDTRRQGGGLTSSRVAIARRCRWKSGGGLLCPNGRAYCDAKHLERSEPPAASMQCRRQGKNFGIITADRSGPRRALPRVMTSIGYRELAAFGFKLAETAAPRRQRLRRRDIEHVPLGPSGVSDGQCGGVEILIDCAALMNTTGRVRAEVADRQFGLPRRRAKRRAKCDLPKPSGALNPYARRVSMMHRCRVCFGVKLISTRGVYEHLDAVVVDGVCD